MRLAHRARTVEPFHAMAVGERAMNLAAQGHDVVKLCLGEPDFGAPPGVRAVMREAMDGRPLPYTAALGLPALREDHRRVLPRAARRRGRPGADRRHGRGLGGAGAGHRRVVDPGDEVIIGDPPTPATGRSSRASARRGRTRARPPPATRFQLDAAAVRCAWTEQTTRSWSPRRRTPRAPRSRPTNWRRSATWPASTARGASSTRSTSTWRPRRQGRPPRSVLSFDPDAIVINSFSKYFGMTGWRLGWCVVPEALVTAMERLAQNYYSLRLRSRPARRARLLHPRVAGHLRGPPGRIRAAGARSSSTGCARIGLPVPVPPDGAFYVYFDVSGTGLDSWEFCERARRRRTSPSPRAGTSAPAPPTPTCGSRTPRLGGNCARGSPGWTASWPGCVVQESLAEVRSPQGAAGTTIDRFDRMPPTCRRSGAVSCGAGDRDRTGMASLEGWGSTIELHPRRRAAPAATAVQEPSGRGTGYPEACSRLTGSHGA